MLYSQNDNNYKDLPGITKLYDDNLNFIQVNFYYFSKRLGKRLKINLLYKKKKL